MRWALPERWLTAVSYTHLDVYKRQGMIVSQPKAGKTTLLKEVAKSVTVNNPEMHLIILLIDELSLIHI